jgi:hypothetical protein
LVVTKEHRRIVIEHDTDVNAGIAASQIWNSHTSGLKSFVHDLQEKPLLWIRGLRFSRLETKKVGIESPEIVVTVQQVRMAYVAVAMARGIW